jgi:hypothetical protein
MGCDVMLFPRVCIMIAEIDGIDPDEKVFLERLQNTSRFASTIPRCVRPKNENSELVNNIKNRVPRTVRDHHPHSFFYTDTTS